LFQGFGDDQSFPAGFVKGVARQCCQAIAAKPALTSPAAVVAFLTAAFEKSRPHAGVGCEKEWIMASLAANP
jgi:hypothetical protein